MGIIFLVIIKCRTVRILSTAIKREEGKAESNLYMCVGSGGGGGGRKGNGLIKKEIQCTVR